MGLRGPVASRMSRRTSGKPVGLQVDANLPKMPAGLPRDVQKLWKEISPMLEELEILSSVDAAALADFCVCLARLRQCEEDISARGILVDGERGKVKNPSCQLARQYRTAVLAWAAQFCMTPVARARMNVKQEKREESLEDILNRPRNDSKLPPPTPKYGAN